MIDVKQRLLALSEEQFRDFSAKLIPTNSNILGVRVPALRQLVKELAKDDWQTFLEEYECVYLEEFMLKGMVIGAIKEDLETVLAYCEKFIPLIDNWAVCDIVCGDLKFAKKYPQQTWTFIQPYLTSQQEYEVRFAVVMILAHFINEEYIAQVLPTLDAVQHEAYYVKMAVAWAVSICFVKFPTQTMAYLHDNHLDDETYNKAIQKIIESRRVDEATKNRLRKMKRKK